MSQEELEKFKEQKAEVLEKMPIPEALLMNDIQGIRKLAYMTVLDTRKIVMSATNVATIQSAVAIYRRMVSLKFK